MGDLGVAHLASCVIVAGRPVVVTDGLSTIHPLLVHFPIALLVTAAVADTASLVFRCHSRLRQLSNGLYIAGAVMLIAAYFTGRSAAMIVRVPGMAHAVIDAHWTSALWTTVYVCTVAAGRLASIVLEETWHPYLTRALVFASILGLALVLQTAEYGGRLVYEFGVGVAAPN